MIYALNLFNVSDKNAYLAYAKQSVSELAKLGAKVVSLGGFGENVQGELEARKVMILVQWPDRDAFDSYLNDPNLGDLHRLREQGTTDYVWQLFDALNDLRPILKD